MRTRIKRIFSEYNEDTGVSLVVLATDCGTFTGKATLHEDDAKYASNYAGCEYAEMRALQKYMKQKAAIARNQLEILYRMKKEIENRKYHNENSVEYKILMKQIYLLEDDKFQCEKNIKTLGERIKLKIELREDVIKRIEKKKKED